MNREDILAAYDLRNNPISRLIKPGSEDDAQAQVIRWAKNNEQYYPDLKLLYAIPNGSNLSKPQRAVMSYTGLRAGMPDIHLPILRQRKDTPNMMDFYIGLWIEMKRQPYRDAKGRLCRGQVSPEQKKMIALLREAGHRVEVCEGPEEGIRVLKDYLG